MRNLSRPLGVALVFVLLALATLQITGIKMKDRYDENDVFIRNLKLFTGSKQYFIKGVNYSPQPLGRPTETGFCSKKMNYEGVFYDACVFEDYFDGVSSDNGGAPHPDGPWWQKVWERDLPLMKELGANTMRIYHMTPFSKALIDKYPIIYSKLVPFRKYAADHRLFLDVAEQYGIKVIAPIVSEESVLSFYSEDELNRFVEARVDEIGNHTALLAWVVGNELGLYTKNELRALVNKMIIKVREYTLEKWNRIVPVTTCEVDLPESYNLLTDELDVDFFMTNAGYRDVHIESLWEPDVNAKFVGWRAKSKEFGLPVLVGEFGMHDQDSQTAGRPDWINQQYRPMVQYMPQGSLGGLFFEFNEETMKPPNQQQMGLVRYSTNTVDGVQSTDNGAFIPDNVTKKDVVFEALQQGLSNSPFKQWNFNNDEYRLANVTQFEIDLHRITPRPFGHLFDGSGDELPMPAKSSSTDPEPSPSPSPTPSPSPSPSPVPQPSPSPSPSSPTPSAPTPSPSPSPVVIPSSSDIHMEPQPGTKESPKESHTHNNDGNSLVSGRSQVVMLYVALFLAGLISIISHMRS